MIRPRELLLPATQSVLQSRSIALFTFLGLLLICSASWATTLVDDHWNSGYRINPPAAVTSPYTTTYSENGTDQDSSGDLNSAWFFGGSASSMSGDATHQDIGQTVLNAGSSSFYGMTYFTNAGTKVNLANAGDQMTVSWTFKTGSSVGPQTTSVGMYFTLTDSSAAARFTNTTSAGGTPNGANFPGYAILGELCSTFGAANTGNIFGLREWAGSANNLFGTSGAWTSNLASDGTGSAAGYAANTTYTMTWTLTRGASNDVVVDVLMAGTGLNGSANQLHVNFDDTSPNSFSYDNFALRASTGAANTNSFTTTNFKVTFVPEPASMVLLAMGAGGLGLLGVKRRRLTWKK